MKQMKMGKILAYLKLCGRSMFFGGYWGFFADFLYVLSCNMIDALIQFCQQTHCIFETSSVKVPTPLYCLTAMLEFLRKSVWLSKNIYHFRKDKDNYYILFMLLDSLILFRVN